MKATNCAGEAVCVASMVVEKEPTPPPRPPDYSSGGYPPAPLKQSRGSRVSRTQSRESGGREEEEEEETQVLFK